MKTFTHPFDPRGNDFEKMWHFLQQDYTQKQDQFIWSLGRLGDWLYGLWNEKKYIPTFFRDHAQLWVDNFEQLIGFVINEDGENTFFIFTRNGYEILYRDILAWTIQNWGPRYTVLKTEVHEYQREALQQLEIKDFHCSGIVATTRQYDLRAKMDEPVRLSSGFKIVKMSDNGDYRSKGLLYNNGFGNQDQINEFELARFEYSRQSPAYDPGFDFSVVTADGLHAATCLAFIDWKNKSAEVEKVCTHTAYRRQGLAEAVIRECFKQLCTAGIETAYIEGYSGDANELYEKLGPQKPKQWFHYELNATQMQF